MTLPLAVPIEGRIVSVRLEIRRNATGEVRGFPYVGDPEVSEFLWSEGNYASDSNRAWFFAWAGGDRLVQNCCGAGVYSVRVTAVDDGCVLYSDFGETDA